MVPSGNLEHGSVNRRAFLRQMIGGVAAVAAQRVFPFSTYSFPTDIKVCFPSANISFESWVERRCIPFIVSEAMAKEIINGLRIPSRYLKPASPAPSLQGLL